LSTLIATNLFNSLSLHDALPILGTQNANIYYTDLLANYKKQINQDFAVGAMVGYTATRSLDTYVQRETATGLSVRNWYDINASRSEEHTSELQSRENLVCRLLLE